MFHLISLSVYFMLTILLSGRTPERKWTKALFWKRFSYAYYHKSLRVDVLSYVINRLIFASVLMGVIGAILFWCFESPTRATHQPFLLTLWAQVQSKSFYVPEAILLNLAFTFAYSLMEDGSRAKVHYSFHKIPALWEFHKFHHSADVLNPITSFRNSALEIFFTLLMRGAGRGLMIMTFISLFGVESLNVIVVFGVDLFSLPRAVFNHLLHSHVWVNWTGKLAYIWSPPACHLIHHSVEDRHLNKNFGPIYSIWDILLGTLYVAKEEEHFRIGVKTADNRKYVNNNFWYIYIGVFQDAYRRLTRKPVSYEQPGLAESYGREFGCWCADPNCSLMSKTFDHQVENSSTSEHTYQQAA